MSALSQRVKDLEERNDNQAEVLRDAANALGFDSDYGDFTHKIVSEIQKLRKARESAGQVIRITNKHADRKVLIDGIDVSNFVTGWSVRTSPDLYMTREVKLTFLPDRVILDEKEVGRD